MPAQRTGTVEEPDWSALYFPYLGAVQAISLHRECNLRVFLETKGVIKGHAEVGDMLLAAVTVSPQKVHLKLDYDNGVQKAF